jgi:hypothetical protein
MTFLMASRESGCGVPGLSPSSTSGSLLSTLRDLRLVRAVIALDILARDSSDRVRPNMGFLDPPKRALRFFLCSSLNVRPRRASLILRLRSSDRARPLSARLIFLPTSVISRLALPGFPVFSFRVGGVGDKRASSDMLSTAVDEALPSLAELDAGVPGVLRGDARALVVPLPLPLVLSAVLLLGLLLMMLGVADWSALPVEDAGSVLPLASGVIRCM